VALLIARELFDSEVAGAVAGGAAFLGHLFPVWLGFRGGKGVATFFGLLIAAAWPLGLLAGATWLIVAALFRISSLAALVASAGGAGPAGARADPCAGRFHGGADLGSAPPEHQPAAEGGGTPHRGREGVTAGGPLPETERFARLRLARTDRVGPVTFKQLLDR